MSGENYLHILNSHPDPICITTLSEGRFVEVNESFINISGYERQDLIGHTSLELGFWSGPDLRAKFVLALLENGVAPVPDILQQSVIFKELNLQPSAEVLQVEDKQYIMLMAHDVTQQQRIDELLLAERNLAIALSTVSSVGEAVPLCVQAAIDTAHMDCGGMLLFDSIGPQSNLIYTQNLSPSIFDGLSLAASNQSTWLKLVRSGHPVYAFKNEIRFLWPDITAHEAIRSLAVVPVHHENQIIACLMVASHHKDHIPNFSRKAFEAIASQLGGVFTRLKAEEKLKESEERYRNILSSIKEGYYEADIRGNIAFCNDALCEIIGHTMTEVLGSSFRDYCTEEVAEKIFAVYSRVYRSGEPIGYLEEKMIKKDGSLFYFEESITPIRDQLGIITGFRGMLRDVTERKLAEEDVRASREHMQTLSRRLMEVQESERRHLSRELHDEFGQSLTALKIKLQTIEHSTTPPNNHLRECISILERILHGIRQLALDLRPSLLDDLGLASALRWHVDHYSQLTDLKSQFITNISDMRFPADIETNCYRVAQEAFTNVLKHSQASNVRVELILLSSALHLIIQDDGIGFDMKDALSGVARGTTMGLLSMKERVALVGGNMTILSAPGSGTRITAVFHLNSSRSDKREEVVYP